jgi:hypothetical protein
MYLTACLCISLYFTVFRCISPYFTVFSPYFAVFRRISLQLKVTSFQLQNGIQMNQITEHAEKDGKQIVLGIYNVVLPVSNEGTESDLKAAT